MNYKMNYNPDISEKSREIVSPVIFALIKFPLLTLSNQQAEQIHNFQSVCEDNVRRFPELPRSDSISLL